MLYSYAKKKKKKEKRVENGSVLYKACHILLNHLISTLCNYTIKRTNK